MSCELTIFMPPGPRSWGPHKYQKRPIIWQKRPNTQTEESYWYYGSMPEVRTSVKRGLSYGKRDLIHRQKRATDTTEACLRSAQVSKETYYSSKRDSIPHYWYTWGPHKCQKRPIYMAKEAYLYGKRGLFTWQKRPIEISIPEERPSAAEPCLNASLEPIYWNELTIYLLVN